jgi:ATP-dependent 26S proteasome regulatory subunit
MKKTISSISSISSIEKAYSSESRNLSPEDKTTKLAECNLDQFNKASYNNVLEDLVIKDFFNKKDFSTFTSGIPSYVNNIMQFAMKDFFETIGFSFVRSFSIHDGEFITKAKKYQIEYEKGKFVDGYLNAFLFFENKTAKDRVCVKITKDAYDGFYYFDVFSSCVKDVFEDWKTYSIENNFYKGQSINPDCAFLDLDENICWEDIIISKEAKDVIQRNVKDLFDKADILEKNGINLKRGIILTGPPGTGKAQPLSSFVYTPDGIKTMGEIKIGDMVCNASGGSSKVVGVYPQGEKEIYTLKFKNGDEVECCIDHLWEVSDKSSGGSPKIVDTKYLIDRVRVGEYRNIRIRVPEPVSFEKRKISIDPYLLGFLLGDGCFCSNGLNFSTADSEILSIISDLVSVDNLSLSEISDYDFRISSGSRGKSNSLVKKIKDLGLWKVKSQDKFIPKDYIYNSVDRRISILQGLMDSDGSVEKTGMPVFYTTSKCLAEGVKEIVQSLGGIATIKEKKNVKYSYNGEIKNGLNSFSVRISIKDAYRLFRLKRKINKVKERTKYLTVRILSSINLKGKEQSQCILLESEDHLYITNNYIITHNTMICKVLAKELSVTVLYVLPSHIRNQGDVAKICDMAKDLAPTLLILEDIDYIAQDRGDGNNWFVIDLMNKMDGIESFKSVVTVATTNLAEKVENAIKNRPGRFDRIINIDNPNSKQVAKMLKKFTEKFQVHKDVDFEGIAAEIDEDKEEMSGAYIKDLCITAVFLAIQSGDTDDNDIAILNSDHFYKALDEIKSKDFTNLSEGSSDPMGFGTESAVPRAFRRRR